MLEWGKAGQEFYVLGLQRLQLATQLRCFFDQRLSLPARGFLLGAMAVTLSLALVMQGLKLRLLRFNLLAQLAAGCSQAGCIIVGAWHTA